MKKTKTVFWDFDGTLGFRRDGMWGASMLEALKQYDPETALTAPSFRKFLQTGFPWHHPEQAYLPVRSPDEWWEPILHKFTMGFMHYGIPQVEAAKLALQTRDIFLDIQQWSLFEDTEQTLRKLQELGWKQGILSNHVPELKGIVESLGIMDYFDCFINSDLIGYENPQMCYIEVDDVNQVYEDFTTGLKRHIGKIPRSGIPRISKLKHLVEDRRFMMTDIGGNTLYIGTPNTDISDPAFYRTIESVEYAKNFEILYDLLYSKEDSNSAFNMLVKFFPADVCSINAEDLDLAKILLVALDVHLQRDKAVNQSINDKLNKLINFYTTENPDWNKISQQYNEIISGE